jgi:hypothetical protein
MLYGTTRAYVGSASQIADGIITYSKFNPYMFTGRARAYRSAADQAIAATTWTKVQLDGETYDPGTMYDNAVNYRFTVAAGYAGYFLVAANLTVYGDAAVGFGRAAIYKNGAVAAIGIQNYPVTAAIASLHVEDLLSLADADYIEIYVYLDAAGHVQTGSIYTWAFFTRFF